MENLIRLSVLRANRAHRFGLYRLLGNSRWRFNICNCKPLSTRSVWDKQRLQQRKSSFQAPACYQLASCSMLNIQKGVLRPFGTSNRCMKEKDDEKNKEKLEKDLEALKKFEKFMFEALESVLKSDLESENKKSKENLSKTIKDVKHKLKNGKPLNFHEKNMIIFGRLLRGDPDVERLAGFMFFLIVLLIAASTFNSVKALTPKETGTYISQSELLHHVIPTGQVEKIVIQSHDGAAAIKQNNSMFRAQIFLHDDVVLKGKKVPKSKSCFIALTDAGAFEQQVRDKEKELGILMQDGLEIQHSSSGPAAYAMARRPSVNNSLIIATPPERKTKNKPNVPYGLLAWTILSLLPTLFYLLGRKSGNVSKHKSSFSNPFRFISSAKFIRADEEIGQKITFKDVAGLDEAKVEVMEFVDFLKHPDKYKKLGGKMPRGALLLGPPGCGKTLLAKAVAAEADVPFLAMAGSQFVEMIGGLGASRVRDLFENAKETSPCVVFIDEIDAIGSKRSEVESLRESDQTLNQLLVELDGMGTDKDIICLAATNRAEDLDKALLRPGRFSRHITIGLPTEKERQEIFKVHLNNLKKLEENTDYLASWLAKITTGRSGADVANICNEAALHAAREQQDSIKRHNFEFAADRTMFGVAKKRSLISQEEKHMIAYHESGQTLVSWMMKTTSPILKMSIVERIGGSLGMSQSQLKEKYLTSNEELFENMCVRLGGRAAEMIVFNKQTSGSRGDIKAVTDSAYSQIRQFGMNETVGLVSFPKPKFGTKEAYSRHLKTVMDHEVQKLILKAYGTAEQVLRDNEVKLHRLASELLKKETLTYHEIVLLIGPPVGERLAEEVSEKVD